jgi:hypothetical protein
MQYVKWLQSQLQQTKSQAELGARKKNQPPKRNSQKQQQSTRFHRACKAQQVAPLSGSLTAKPEEDSPQSEDAERHNSQQADQSAATP